MERQIGVRSVGGNVKKDTGSHIDNYGHNSFFFVKCRFVNLIDPGPWFLNGKHHEAPTKLMIALPKVVSKTPVDSALALGCCSHSFKRSKWKHNTAAASSACCPTWRDEFIDIKKNCWCQGREYIHWIYLIQIYTNIWYMHPVSSKSLPYFLFHVCLAQKLYGHTCFIEHWDKEWFSLRQLMWRWDCENMQGTGQNQKLCHWYLGLGREAWLGWAVAGKHVLFLKTESTPSWKESFTCSRRNLIIAKHRFLKGLLCFLKWACLEWKILVQKDMVVSTHTASFTLNLLFWLETSFFHGMLHNWVVCYLKQCCTLEKTSGFLKWNVVLET